MDKKNLYKDVADKLIEALKAGTAPWQRPWVKTTMGGLPANGVSNRKYSGINQIVLYFEQQEKGYSSPQWATFKQAKEKGWKIKKGAKSTLVYFFKMLDVENTNKQTGEVEKKKIPLLQCYPVFNFDQIEGAPAFERPHYQWTPIQAVEVIRERLAIPVNHGGDRCFYRRSEDAIYMTHQDAFPTPEKYASVLCHEMAHATGHESRLNRQFGTKFGDADYAKEELRAEIASFMIAIEHGIDHDPEHHASYVASWIKVLEDDPKEIFRACRDAEKICAFLNGAKNELESTIEQSQANTPDTGQELIVGPSEAQKWGVSAGTGKVVIITDPEGKKNVLIGSVLIKKYCASNNVPDEIKDSALELYEELKNNMVAPEQQKAKGLASVTPKQLAATLQASSSMSMSP